jgi:hypothetical protein
MPLFRYNPHLICVRRSLNKAIMGQAKGRAIIPKRTDQSWFWTPGDVAIDWWDLPYDVPLYVNSAGVSFN